MTRTLDAEVEIPNADGALRPGMYGHAALVTDVEGMAYRTGTSEFVFDARDSIGRGFVLR